MTTQNLPCTLSVVFDAKPGCEKELETLLTTLVAPTRKESGCIQYDLHRCKEDPQKFMFYEIWANQATLDAHHQSAHLKAFREKIGDLLIKPRERLNLVAC